MAQVRVSQYKFSAGQAGADLDNRSDLDFYMASCKEATNVYVIPQGGLVKRRGFKHIADVADAGALARFRFSIDQQFLICFQPSRIQIYDGEIQLFDTSSDVYVVGTANGSFTSTQTIIINGTTITLTGSTIVDAMNVINTYSGTTNVSADQITDAQGNYYLQLYNESSGSDIVIGGGSAIGGLGITAATYTLQAVSYTSDQLADLRWTQSYDTFLIFHEDFVPRELRRGLTDFIWTVSPAAFVSVPFDSFISSTDQPLTPSGTTGSITLTLGAGPNYWTSEHVGVRINVNGGYAMITSISTGLVANADVVNHLNVSVLTGTGADPAWEEEVWSAKHGYPRSGTFFQNRLFIGGSRDLPQNFFASKTGDIFNYDASVDSTGNLTDDKAIDFALSSPDVAIIRALMPARSALHLFTTSTEFSVTSEPVTPSNISAAPNTYKGITNVRPCVVDDETLFIDATGKSLYSYVWNQQQLNQFITKNRTVLAQDILSDAQDMAYVPNYKNSQSNLVFVVNDDGTLSVLTVDTQKQVEAWTKWTTNGNFLNVCEVGYVLYALVERGGTIRLEGLTEREIYLDGFYDATSNTGITSWSGATSLASQTVGCQFATSSTDIANCFVGADVAIDSGGNFTVNEASKAIAVGHRYTARVETNPLAFALNGQLVRGERIRKLKAEVTVRNTKQLKVDGRDIPLRKFGLSLLDQDLVAADTTIHTRISGISTDPTVVFESDDPLPMQINATTITAAFKVPPTN